jgi:hypothetical protein
MRDGLLLHTLCDIMLLAKRAEQSGIVIRDVCLDNLLVSPVLASCCMSVIRTSSIIA